MRVVEVHVALPHADLPGADWADCFEITRAGQVLTAREAAEQCLSSFPLWIRVLMRARDGLVRPLGLKTAASVTSSRRIGPFPVLREDGNHVVLGLDDRHLDFRLVVETRAPDGQDQGQTIRLTTLVQRRARFGAVYLAAITPFHRVIVAATLNRLATRPLSGGPAKIRR